MVLPVPLADSASDEAASRHEILTAVERVVVRGNYILGAEVARFETQMAERLGVAGAVGVASGTDALVLALLAVGVRPRDEVVTVSHTAGPTVAAIRMVGAVPVFADVDASTYCIDPAGLQACIGPRTRAAIVVHLYGHPADMERIGEIAGKHSLPIIEDCAQAIDSNFRNRPVGSFGTVGCFSFYPSKNLGAIGDGGMVVAQDSEVVERVRALRTYGWSRPQFAEISGGRCSRLDEVQAAVLSVKLGRLAEVTERRRVLAERYREAFADLPMVLPREMANCRHVYHLYVVRSKERDALASWLREHGVGTGIHYPCPVHVQPGLAEGSRIPKPLAVTESIAREVLSMPMFPSMTEAQQEHAIGCVRGYYGPRRD